MPGSKNFPWVSRRRFIKAGASLSLLALLGGKTAVAQAGPKPDSVIVAENGTPEELVSGALDAIGGIERFVGPGDSVLIKPNASFIHEPVSGRNTRPEIVSTVVEKCFGAGASRVVLADFTLDMPGSIVVDSNGLKRAAEDNGGEFVVLGSLSDFTRVGIEGSRALENVEVANVYNECDVLINLPILKHHDASGTTVGLKNLMGLVYNRGIMHRVGLHQSIADLSLAIKPDLTIVDATVCLMTNGPRGPGEVHGVGKVVAGVDPVAVDVASMALGNSLGYDNFDVDSTWNVYIENAADLGVGDGDPESVLAKTFELDVEGTGNAGETPTTAPSTAIPQASFTDTTESSPGPSLAAASAVAGLAAMIYHRKKLNEGKKKKG